jgi:hypothetical protein
MQLSCSLCICESLCINFWMPETVFMETGMYIMSLEPFWPMYFMNPSHQFVCLHVYPPVVARQRFSKKLLQQLMNTQQFQNLLNA